jgi:hypothetical protein
VDAFGRLKPGVPFKKDGTLADGTSGEFIFGVSVGGNQIVDKGPTNTTLGANTGVAPVAVATIAQVNRDIAEDVLGRAYSANEIAAFDAAGSKLVLTRT